MRQLSFFSILFLFSPVNGQNPQYTFSIDGPCGDTIKGSAGAQFDDGTFGVPEFDRGGIGWTWVVKLTKENSPADDTGKTLGWKWSLGTENLVITAITRNGTITCPTGTGPNCQGGGAFNHTTELTGAPSGKGPFTVENHGALSEVLLGIDGTFLPGDGCWPIAKIRVTTAFDENEGGVKTGRIFFVPRTGSSNTATDQLVYYDGVPITLQQGNPPITTQTCEVSFLSVGPVNRFIRCDPNDDSIVNISDPIWILTELFHGGLRAQCPITRDCNNDNKVDVSDAVYALTHLFGGGPPPPPPFPDCGAIEGLAHDDCPGGSTKCP